jgi:nitrous oxidase accessory protein
MLRFQSWMVDYGTNLDPKAALDFGAFVPPLLGTAHRGNFTIQSFPAVGAYILFVAGALGPILAGVDLWRRRKARATVASALALCLAGAAATSVEATEFLSYDTPPEPSTLQPLVEEAAPGDTLFLPPGIHFGQLVIDRSLTLVGTPDCILDGKEKGTVVLVQAPHVSLRGFTVRASGYELLVDDAGIMVDEADDAVLEDLTLLDTNHGIYVRNAFRPVVRGCHLVGRKGRVHEENHGNGIHIWYAKDAVIEGNDVAGHRDGIYLSFAETARIAGNLAHDVDRFGLHSMYSQENVLVANTFTRNTAGVALMFSNRMRMEGNLFLHNRGHRTYGLLLRDCSDSDFRYNRLIDNTIALFLDGSNRNRFRENLFAENGWGVIAYSSSEGNTFTRNNFLANDIQVSLDMRRTRNRFEVDGVGNYWSDARPYDLDGDGQGDNPHFPVGLFAFVSKQHPDLTVFSGSPAVVALDLAQRSLPALQLTELVDSRPRLNPDPIPPFEGPAVPASPEGARATAALGLFAALATLSGSTLLFRAR